MTEASGLKAGGVEVRFKYHHFPFHREGSEHETKLVIGIQLVNFWSESLPSG